MAQTLFPLPEDSQTELLSLRNLFQLLSHRNKNQHRHSIWWRSFDSLRRELGKLALELQIDDGGKLDEKTATKPKAKQTFEEKTRERHQKEALMKRAEDRVSFWREEMVESWFRAFSQLAASNRFAQLGLVLLASLARICHLLGITAAYQEQSKKDMQATLLKLGKTDTKNMLNTFASTELELLPSEDFGEVITREPESNLELNRVENITMAEAQDPGIEGEHDEEEITVKPKKKNQGLSAASIIKADTRKPKPSKKKKKGNAIDDIFGGFG